MTSRLLNFAPVVATDVSFALTREERADLQRRTLRILTMGQVVGAAALGAAITVGGYVVEDIVGVDTPWVGLSTAGVTAGSGVMAQLLSRLMRARGRRPGMAAGYGLAVVGGVISCAGVQTSFLPVFLLGLFLYGAGSATNLQARYAATDLAEPEHRSRAMGTILFASTFGSVFGPLLVQPAEHLGMSWFGMDRYAGPWLFSSFFFGCAALNILFRLKPDPLLVWQALNQAQRAADGEPGGGKQQRIRFTDAMLAVFASPVAVLALWAMIVAQAVMVGVMAMTPIDMKMHGHETVSPYVVSIHIAGMFAFSPLVGRYADRRGRLASLRTGSLVLIAACAISALATDNVPLMFVGMWALGIGWTFSLIGGSSLLIDNVPDDYRVAVQGSVDMFTAVCGGIAGVACGFLMEWIGFALLGVLSAAICLPILGAVQLQSRRTPLAVVE